MAINRILPVAVAFALGAATAQAGGLSPAIPQEPVTVTVETVAPAPSSMLIPILGSALIIGLMAIAASDCGPCAK